MNIVRTLSLAAAALSLLAAHPAVAASNPEVEEPECEKSVEESCEGVTGPSAGSVSASATCSNFTFRVGWVSGGSESVSRREVYSGGEDCMEPKDLGVEKTGLPAQVSWEAVSVVRGVPSVARGYGSEAVVPRANGACRATCTFEVTVSPSVCSPPAPVVRTAEAVFRDDVSVDERRRPRLCRVSADHEPHEFILRACDCPEFSVEPSSAAVVVTNSSTNAVVRGLSAYEGATAIAEAPCGRGTNAFDVVDIGSFAVSGLCGCLSASDSTDDDADAPEVETMDLGPGATGFSMSLPVTPSKWAQDARWRVAESGWMPAEGNFADGELRTYSEPAGKYPATIDAWFDCDPDNVRAPDEPKRRVTGTIARLGELEVRSENHEGDTDAVDETFAPGETAILANTGFLPANRAHGLRVAETIPEDKGAPMTISTADIKPDGALNRWRIMIPDNCGDGIFKVELTDPLHSCTSVVKTLQVKACPCSSCGTFSETDPKNGCIDVTFGLGRTSSGGGKAPVRFVLDRTDDLPDISSESAPDGRMDVSSSNGVMTVAFTRTGEQVPVAVYTLTPGACAFTMRETRDGSLRKTAVWTHADGVWTMEVFDEAVAPRELLRRDVRTTRATARGAVHTLARGVESVETETEEIDGIGPVAVRETRGTGADARTTWKSYYASGAAKGRVRSELFPDGSWTMYTYDATGRVETVVAPFGDSSPALDDRNAVIGYNGAVRRTTYSYAPVDGRDDGTTLADESRTIVESVGSDAAGWREVSRRYAAHFVADGVRVEVSERAASPGAAYGAAGNQRTISTYLWSRRGAGRPVRRETPDGLVATWAYDFTPSNVVVETMTVPSAATNGIPFKTTVERAVEDLRGDVLREETYVVTDSGRELLSWTDYERDAAGHELRRESSDGSLVERAWSCCGPEWEMDERGIVTVYSYDALGRQATMTRSGVTTLWNYDLAGNATNVTRFADALIASSATGYDSAGRLAWNVGEDGVRTEYAYSTSPEGGEVRTTIRAADTDCAATNTVVSFRDGSTKASYLNGILKSTEVHELFASATYEGTNGLASARWTRSETDFLGRTISESRPGFGGSTIVTSNLYDTAGRLASTLSLSTRSTRSTRLNSQLYFYNELNESIASIDDRNFNEIIDWTGPDLISSNLTHYVKLNGDWWRETRQWSIHDDNSAEARLMNVSRSRITGLGVDSLASESVTINQRGNETLSRTFCNRDAAEEIAWTKYPTSTTPAVTISTNGLIYSSTSQTGVTTTFGYDAFQRQIAQTDGRGNTTHTVYDNFGRVAKTIDALGHETAYAYDALGRQTAVTDPLGHTVTTAYDAEDHILSQRGATYPVDYAYDAYGNKVAMTTYRNEALTNGDTTRWLYDEPSGCMTNKVYADGKGPSYDYTSDGKLARRTWARGIATDYTYDNAGQLVSTTYSDNTPTITMTYDRVGNLTEATTAGVVTNLYAYDIYGHCTNEWQNDFNLTRYYDTLGRSTGYAINGTPQTTIAYDTYGRIGSMSLGLADDSSAQNANDEFTWTYLPGSDLKSSLQYPNSLTASWQYDANNQLLQVRNATPTNVISQFDYTYDAAGRRTSITKTGSAFGDLSGSVDTYTYNARSELTSARRTKNGQPIPGFSEDFDYDPIGNRRSSSTYNEKGEAQTSTYQANNLNQYTSRTTPGYAAVRGEADPNATVTVNENPTFRLGSYYFGSGLFDNTAAGGFANLETYATLAQTAANGDETDDLISSETNQVYIAQSPETFDYDDDGNQTLVTTKTGLWRVTYNGENRPILWVRDSDNTTLSMCYDHMGRRREKNDQRFFYDGYLQIYNYHTTTTTPDYNYFLWDPSEPIATRPLVLKRGDTATYYTHDGNKNVSEIVSDSSAIVAHYEYAAFGTIIAQCGESSVLNPWRFSCEYSDDEIGCDYYNYRDYEPISGRWIGRDRVFVRNLYAYVENNFGRFDVLGNVPWDDEFFKQYPSYEKFERDQVWNEVIGGTQGPGFSGQNSCAARISAALNRIPSEKIKGPADFINEKKGGQGIEGRFIINARSMNKYLIKRWGTTSACSKTKAYYFTSSASDVLTLRSEVLKRLSEKKDGCCRKDFVVVYALEVDKPKSWSGHIGVLTGQYNDNTTFSSGYKKPFNVWILPKKEVAK